MTEPKVSTFFYGSYVNRRVLKEVNILAPAREFAFPSWYIERLESFRTG